MAAFGESTRVLFLHGNTWNAGEWILEGMHVSGDRGLLHAAVADTRLWWLWRIRNEALHSATFKPISTVFHLFVGMIWAYDMAKIPNGFRQDIIPCQTVDSSRGVYYDKL